MSPRISTRCAEALAAAALAGCAGPQSALDAGGEAAGRIAGLAWGMFVGAALILGVVIGLLAWAVWAPDSSRRWLAGDRAIVAGGLVLPVVVLTVLLVAALTVTDGRASGEAAGLRIRVEGEQWWWRVTYLDPDGRPLFATANEIRIPAGRAVDLELHAADVIHSFWVPALAGKLDMIPGHVNVLRLQADRVGRWRGQCAEYCGGAHAWMAFVVVAEPGEVFEAWVAGQRAPAPPPADPFLARGRELFLAFGCPACHTVRGTGAMGVIGPDLTHVGGRLTIGAGMLPNHVGTLAAWIVDAPHLKPGNRMPGFPVFTGEDLRALAAWLESLK